MKNNSCALPNSLTKTDIKTLPTISPVKIIFAFCLIILALLSVLSYRQNLDLIKKSLLVNHTNLVILEANNELSLLKDAETGTRGFLLTHDSAFLLPYTNSLSGILVSLHALDSLVEEPKQQQNVKKLKGLTISRLSVLRKLIGYTGGPAGLQQLLRQSKAEMDLVRAHIALMIFEEERLLRLRTESLNSAVSFAPTINVLLAGFSILLLIFAYFKILKELELTRSLQRQLITSNDVLKKSNSDLAQFAYVASHDLQEPLRKIQTFISLIDDTEKNISEKGKDYFSRVTISAKRMQQLILDILAYAGVNNEDKNFNKTDLNIVLDAAKEQMEELIRNKNAIINAELLPSVHGVKYQLEQVFTNLIGNALKFSKPGTQCVILITVIKINGEKIPAERADKNRIYYCIKISDNGIGFDPKYGERIFQIFNRLHAKEIFDGNGIGLSIVKKIMETHNGFVASAGTLNEGAAFSLYLPA